MKGLIKALLPVKTRYKLINSKRFLKGYFGNKNNFNNKEKTIYLIGTPIHGNLGDQAIAYAQNKFIIDNLSEYKLLEITINNFPDYYLNLRKNIKKEDIILLHGGGNMGVKYFGEEIFRRIVIESFPNNKIVIFPQTIDYGNNAIGLKEFKESKKVYSKHSNLIILAREDISYEVMKNNYINNKVLLIPDIVTYLNKENNLVERKGVLICLRNDSESNITIEEKSDIEKIVQEYCLDIIYTDTVIDNTIKIEDRDIFLNNKFEEFKNAQIIITDRLHGMVFAAITGTPCLVLSNYNHKVKGVYEWIKHLDYIKYIDNNIDEIPLYINKLMSLSNCKYENDNLTPYFKKLSEIIKN